MLLVAAVLSAPPSLLPALPELARRAPSAQDASDNVTVVLISDRSLAARCLATVKSLRTVGKYTGSMVYMYADDPPDEADAAAFAASSVELVGHEVVISSAIVGPSVLQQQLNTTPPSCNYVRDCPAARVRGSILSRRARGWRAYYLKAMGLTSPYWAWRGFRRVLYVDCGIEAQAAPLNAFFSDVDSSGRVVGENDQRMIFGSACTTHHPSFATLASQFHPECGAALFSRLFQRHADPQRALLVPTMASTFLLLDTSLLIRQPLPMLQVHQYYAEYGAIFDSDQSALNLVFGPLGLNVWSAPPSLLPGAAGNCTCFFAYAGHPVVKTACPVNQALLVKVPDESPLPPPPPSSVASPAALLRHEQLFAGAEAALTEGFQTSLQEATSCPFSCTLHPSCPFSEDGARYVLTSDCETRLT